jgi:plastocyanin
MPSAKSNPEGCEMTRRLLLLLAAGAALIAAPNAVAATTAVNIARDGFQPTGRTINVGDTVVWRNADTVNHQVVADNGSFASPILSPGRTYSFTFQAAGTYRYRDALEPAERGTIVVKGAPPSVAIAASTPIVTYGAQIHVTGQVSSKQAGEQVVLFGKPYPQGSFVEVARVLTTGDGVFDFVTAPTLLTEYQAHWTSVSSIVVRVEVKPRITIRYNRRTRMFTTTVTGASSFAGRSVYLQRLSAFGQWVNVKKVVLREGGQRSFRATLPRGRSNVRIFMTVNQAGAGYLAGLSGVWTLTRRR